jgi:hypothetical protein
MCVRNYEIVVGSLFDMEAYENRLAIGRSIPSIIT